MQTDRSTAVRKPPTISVPVSVGVERTMAPQQWTASTAPPAVDAGVVRDGHLVHVARFVGRKAP